MGDTQFRTPQAKNGPHKSFSRTETRLESQSRCTHTAGKKNCHSRGGRSLRSSDGCLAACLPACNWQEERRGSKQEIAGGTVAQPHTAVVTGAVNRGGKQAAARRNCLLLCGTEAPRTGQPRARARGRSNRLARAWPWPGCLCVLPACLPACLRARKTRAPVTTGFLLSHCARAKNRNNTSNNLTPPPPPPHHPHLLLPPPRFLLLPGALLASFLPRSAGSLGLHARPPRTGSQIPIPPRPTYFALPPLLLTKAPLCLLARSLARSSRPAGNSSRPQPPPPPAQIQPARATHTHTVLAGHRVATATATATADGSAKSARLVPHLLRCYPLLPFLFPSHQSISHGSKQAKQAGKHDRVTDKQQQAAGPSAPAAITSPHRLQFVGKRGERGGAMAGPRPRR